MPLLTAFQLLILSLGQGLKKLNTAPEISSDQQRLQWDALYFIKLLPKLSGVFRGYCMLSTPRAGERKNLSYEELLIVQSEFTQPTCARSILFLL